MTIEAGWNLSLAADREDRVTELSRTLPPGAEARIAYDAYPGFRFHEVLRDLTSYHCRNLAEAQEKREQSIAILNFVARAGQSALIQDFVTGELKRLQAGSVEDFDYEFDLTRKAFRQSDVREMMARHGLCCRFEDANPLDAAGEVFVSRAVEGRAEADAVGRDTNSLYHEVAYPEFLHADLHPDRLATMARIFGLVPAPIDSCRVLELGCGTGLTMLNSALDLRGARFVGIDFSEIHIQSAKDTAEKLHLDNVEFHSLDILNFDSSYGEFDYIVAHGMYSWLPESIRRRMLAVCRDHLSPQGVAYLCFNAKPGYHFPGMLRDFGLDTSGGKVNGVEDAKQAFERMKRLPIASLPPHRRAIVQPAFENCWKANPGYSVYDELADVNTAFLFDSFAAELAEFGFQYLAETDIKNWSAKTLSAAAQQLLDGLLEDPVRRMQYRDFLYLTRFHSSLFCRAERKPSYSPLPAVLDSLLLSSRGRPKVGDPDVRSEGVTVTFEAPGGAEVNIGDPLLKSALVTLFLEYPKRFSLPDLLREASALSGQAADADKLRRWIQPLWETGFLDLHSRMPHIALEPGSRPLASPLSRMCAREGRKVPSMTGIGAELNDDRDRELLVLLDGTRDLDALASESGLDMEELTSRLRAIARLGLLLLA